MNAIDVTPYTQEDHDAVTRPGCEPLSTVPLESMAPTAPAQNDVIVVSRRRVRFAAYALLGAIIIVGTAWAIVGELWFVTSASEIDAAWNALCIVAGGMWLGALGGGVGTWAWGEAGR